MALNPYRQLINKINNAMPEELSETIKNFPFPLRFWLLL